MKKATIGGDYYDGTFFVKIIVDGMSESEKNYYHTLLDDALNTLEQSEKWKKAHKEKNKK